MGEFAVDDTSVLGNGCGDERGLDCYVLIVDLDVRSLLGIDVDKGRAGFCDEAASGDQIQ